MVIPHSDTPNAPSLSTVDPCIHKSGARVKSRKYAARAQESSPGPNDDGQGQNHRPGGYQDLT